MQASGILAIAILLAGCTAYIWPRPPQVEVVPGGDPVRGAELLAEYGCGACHTIPGIPGARTVVGPPLNQWAQRHFIAGSLPNTAENLVAWIQYPQSIEPGTAMPNLEVSEEEARHMSAYLYTLGRE